MTDPLELFHDWIEGPEMAIATATPDGRPSVAYWESRPAGSRRSAAASHQSEPAGSREELEAAVDALPPEPERPGRWGGWEVLLLQP